MKVLCDASATIVLRVSTPAVSSSIPDARRPVSAPDRDGAVRPGQSRPRSRARPRTSRTSSRRRSRNHAGDEEVDPDPAQDAAQLGGGTGPCPTSAAGCRRVADAGRSSRAMRTGHPMSPGPRAGSPGLRGAGPAAASSIGRRSPVPARGRVRLATLAGSRTMALMELTESFEWEGRRIAWARTGSGPPVVFCHGTPFSSRVWAPYAEALADRPHRAPVGPARLRPLVDGPGAPGRRRRPRQGARGTARPLGPRSSRRSWRTTSADWSRSARTWSRERRTPRCSWSTWSRSGRAGRRSSGSSRRTRRCCRSSRPTSTRRSCAPTSATPPTAGCRAEELDALVEPWTGGVGQPAFYRQIADYDLDPARRERAPASASSTSRCGSSGAPRTPGSRWRTGAGSRDWSRARSDRGAGGRPPDAVRRPGRAGHRAARLARLRRHDGPWPTRAQDSPPSHRTWWTCRTS